MFGSLMPREGKFFDLFNQHADRIAAGSRELALLMEHYSDMEVMWNFATAEDTAAKLENAGFTDVKCSLEPKDVTPEDARAFVTTVTLGPHLSKLPEGKREAFVDGVMEESADPLVLDYVRLNMEGKVAE